MRIVLLYPPPWKIALPGETLENPADGPPPGIDHRVLSGDILNIPYGLLSLAAQAKQDGHDVAVLNLFTFLWRDITKIITHYRADLYGLSCFSANRRGTLMLARLIRKTYPAAHIAVGGPHASALPAEMLRYCDAIDTVIIGEGEDTFKELIIGLQPGGTQPTGIPGTAWRTKKGIEVGPSRKRIKNLDQLASLHDYFNEYILITSRGCPWNCTFCCSPSLWGKKRSVHSATAVLDMMETVVNTHGQKAVAIKDETFTQNKPHVLAICRGILKRKLNFLWSCDTRADVLDEELLFSMRTAGCRRISLGIESASAAVLQGINKNLNLDTVRNATALAKKFGFQVRFYMIVGSRNETLQTLQESIDFIKEVRPNQVIWNPFTLLPGSQDFVIAEQKGEATREMFFSDHFFELCPLLRVPDAGENRKIIDWLLHNSGLQTIWDYSAAECEEILELFPDLPAARLELAGAYYREGNLAAAKAAVLQALAGDVPLPGIGYNVLACIAARQGDFKSMLKYLIQARQNGFHKVVEENVAEAQKWIRAGGPNSAAALSLKADTDFEVTRPTMQPTTPGKIIWGDATIVPARVGCV